MSFAELFLLAVGLSMDAFAVAICIGLSARHTSLKMSLIVGLYFGLFQAGMPAIGYMVGALFAEIVAAYDHWIAFGLLAFLGGKMILESMKKENASVNEDSSGKEDSLYTAPGYTAPGAESALRFSYMIPLAFATSIDALAVGVSFAFLRVSILPAVTFIGVTTLVISMAGVKVGSVFGARYQSVAERTGGVVLVLIGLKILVDTYILR
ncbi:MAG: manganese efflux pump MntP family protein [Clostridiales bacterium]|nr:manganese efflux pump MntP family protein [Clostridiales bacterium]